MFILKMLYKLLFFLLARPLLLLFGIAIIIIVKSYFQGGILNAIFSSVIVFYFSIIILALYGIYDKRKSVNNKSETYIEVDDEGVKNIDSEVPTAIVSRINGKNIEHVILSKHTKLPQKITYE